MSANTLSTLQGSDVKLRTFSIGNSEGCQASAPLGQLAAATGDSCFVVSSPAGLSAALSGSQPSSVSAVQVTVADRTFPATIDITGAWRVRLTIGAGTYNVRAIATLSTDGTVSASRTITVAASSSPLAPAAGTVTGLGARLTSIFVRRPAPLLADLPRLVRGRVGTPSAAGKPVATKALENAVVLLYGRTGANASWVKVGSAKVASDGGFVLSWKRLARIH